MSFGDGRSPVRIDDNGTRVECARCGFCFLNDCGNTCRGAGGLIDGARSGIGCAYMFLILSSGIEKEGMVVYMCRGFLKGIIQP